MGYRHGKNTIWYGRPPPGFRIPGSYQYTGERLPKKKEKPKPKVPDVFIRLTDNLELRLRPLEFVFTLFPHSQQRSRDVDDWSVIQVLKRIIKNRHCPEVEIQAFQRGRDFPVGAVTRLLVRNVSEAVARDVASAVISIERGVKLRVEMRPYKPHATFSQLKAKYEEVYGPPETNRCFKDSLPGERPDTIILEGVPVPWLEIYDGEDVHKAAARVFGALGEVRKALVRRMFHSKNYSACRIYVQYADYQTFATALRRMVGMELVRQGSSHSARLTVEVDLEQYLSEAAETRREHDSATKARRAKAREAAELELDDDVQQRRKPARACKAAQEAAAVVDLVVDRACSTIERLHAEELVAERKAAAQARMAELERTIAALETRRSELQREQAARLQVRGHGNSLVAGYDSGSEVSSG